MLNYCFMSGLYIVSGSSQGIGAAIIAVLAENNHPVLALSRTELITKHPLITPYICDLDDDTSINRLGEFCNDKSIIGLIHSAGIISLGPLAESTRDQWERIYNTNVIGAVRLTQAVLPQLRKTQGRVLFINSGQGKTVSANWSAYAASKHALRAVANGLRIEEPLLQVTTIYPGRVDTHMQRNVVDYEKKIYDPTLYCDPNTIAQTVLNVIQLASDSLIQELTIRPNFTP